MKPEEFEAFVLENQHSLINYVTHLTRSRERAEEIAQDAFVRFYRNMERCRDNERLTPYLFRIATNLVVTQIRRDQRWKRILPLFTVMQPTSSAPSDRHREVAHIAGAKTDARAVGILVDRRQ